MSCLRRVAGNEAARATGLTLALVVVLAGCASAPASSSRPDEVAGSVFAPTAGSTRTASTLAIRTPITPLGDATLAGVTPGAAWNAIGWTGSAGLAPIGDTFRWKGGWIAQVTPPFPASAEYRAEFYLSSDGTSWRHLRSNLGLPILRAASGDQLLAITGNLSDSEQSLWVSSDAATWSQLTTSGLDGTGIASIAGGRAGFVAVERSGSIVWSVDGTAWQHETDIRSFHGIFDAPGSVVFIQDRFLLFGQSPVIDQWGGSPSLVRWSSDGRTWSESGPEAEWVGAPVQVFAGRSGLIAQTGNWSAGYRWFHSADGSSWESLYDFPPVGRLENPGDPPRPGPDGLIAADGERIVAYSWEGRAWTSSDGVKWSPLSVPPNSALDIGKANHDAPSKPHASLQVLPRGLLLIMTAPDGGTTQEYGAAG